MLERRHDSRRWTVEVKGKLRNTEKKTIQFKKKRTECEKKIERKEKEEMPEQEKEQIAKLKEWKRG